jgi:hypothetical protein
LAKNIIVLATQDSCQVKSLNKRWLLIVDVIMHKDDVLSILLENKQKHIKEYEEQINGWKEKMEEFNGLMQEWVVKGGIDKRPHEPFKPQNFIDTYDKYINMLKHHVDMRINLAEFEFDQIVNDEFNWKGTFLANSNLYTNVN